MTCGCLVTGTDTGVGKTLVSCALLHALRRQGLRAVGMKPIAAGCERSAAGLLVNEDVEALLRAGDAAATRDDINVYAFVEPIAPHIAAAQAGVRIDLAHIVTHHRTLASRFDAVVVEGAGGWRVPLDEAHDFADLAQALALPVILVVGMRLGCLNHALLTLESIQRRGLTLAGWVANHVDPGMARLDENVAALRTRIAAPLLSVVPFQTHPDPARIVLEHDLLR
ncbi:MAG: dethiobiotin synthase [Burkholderiales bacterium]|nr:dethiobiotin synthase [Burkholderiales bacterium]